VIDTRDKAACTGAARARVANRVTAVFTTYNSAQVIGSALRSVPGDVRCIVVDNASRDATRAVAAQARNDAKIIAMPENAGFGRACNVGLRLVETEYCLLINPDVILSCGCVDHAVAVADAHREFALFGTSDSTGKDLNYQPSDDVRPVEMVTGAFMLLRMADFKKIGYFDENLFMYFEDDDLCLRTRLAGYGVAAVDGIKIEHTVGGSTAPQFDNALERSRIYGQSCAYFAAKHKDRPEGRRVARMVACFRLKCLWNALEMNFSVFPNLRAERHGAKEFRDLGKKVMFENAFTQAQTQNREIRR